MKRLNCFYLDLKSFPTLFMGRERCAKYHLKHVCPKCPGFRRRMNDVDGVGDCWWHLSWSSGNFDIPKTAGVLNWFRQYLYLRMDLGEYRKISKKKK
ncbi:hypothetical protein KY359_06760 [Candidatus Woesearchaeota archaeon]|nr:hypothetical protein [Candidatus Woesearchaeota archaeon]